MYENHHPSPAKQRSTPKKFSLKQRAQRLIQLYKLKLIKIRATPHQIALGFGLGVFAAFLPILPLQILLALLFAFLVGASKPAAFIGTLVSNPLNTIPLHMAYYQIGKLLVPFEVPYFSWRQIEVTDFLDLGWKLYATLSLGALCLAIPCSIISYFIIGKLVEAYRKRKLHKRLANSQPENLKGKTNAQDLAGNENQTGNKDCPGNAKQAGDEGEMASHGQPTTTQQTIDK